MPIISVFFGIVIKMYYRDHNPPHFHAEYQGFEAFFDIQNGKIILGEFPPKAQKIIKEWVEEHQEELNKNWKLSKQNQPLFKIPGADQ